MTFKISNKTIYISLAWSLCTILVYFGCFYQKDLVLFPSKNNLIDYFNDSLDQGNSQILEKIKSDTSVGIKFVLKEGFIAPFVGISFKNTNSKQFIDLSNYNRITINASGIGTKALRLFFVTKEEKVMNQSHRLAQRYIEGDIFIDEKNKDQELNFKDFPTADWWYDVIDQDKNEFGEVDWTKVLSISFNTGVNNKLNQECSYNLRYLCFKKDNTLAVIILCTVQFLAILGSWIIFDFKPKHNNLAKKEIVIKYQPVHNQNDSTNSPDFLEYIHQNYKNSELSLSDVAENSKMSERKISELISEQFECNFKTYINHIRIAEAKRLISDEKALNISEIAYMVGFNSPNSFNRVFKNITGMSPTEYLQNTHN